MNRLIRCELYKFFKRKSFILIILFIIISSFLTCYFSNKNYTYNGFEKLTEYNEYFINQNKIYDLYNYNNFKLNSIMDNGVTLFIFMTIIIIIISCSIMDASNIKENLVFPYKRSKVLLSKYFTTYILTFLTTIFVFIVYILCIFILTKTNIFIIKDYLIFNGKIVNTLFILKYLFTFFMVSIPIYFLSTFTIFTTMVIKNQKVVIALNSILFIMSPVILNFFLNIKFKYIIYTFLPYLDFSIFKNAYDVYLLNITYNIDFNIIKGIIVLVSYMIVFIILGNHLFTRKDFY